ncbi:hypothetical protein CEXT_550011 [Caerostris extrusa]|uniref:Ycf15 n=1 Tax=Caerostris extrusa TaxID=172846 RepID=A0AAV4X5C3_CAEEX|nr:hypothetical protein CEXT_550011 [Caerostris extrusa]
MINCPNREGVFNYAPLGDPSRVRRHVCHPFEQSVSSTLGLLIVSRSHSSVPRLLSRLTIRVSLNTRSDTS